MSLTEYIRNGEKSVKRKKRNGIWDSAEKSGTEWGRVRKKGEKKRGSAGKKR